MATKVNCKTCNHFEAKGKKCIRFPEEVKKSEDDRCGEYKIRRK